MKTSPHSVLPVIKACIFDMDGLLINSEDLYTICINEILHEHGKPDLPWNIKAQLQGRPGPEAGRIFHEWAQLPITHDEFMAKQRELQKKYFPSTQPLPGVPELLATLESSNPKIHMALATSSHRGNFDFKTRHLEHIFSVFKSDHRVLGDDPRIPAGRGKPAPDIYLLALQTINERLRATGQAELHPEECLVFEDSVPGVEAGRRAGMQVVWCPHDGLLNEYRGREQEVLAGLTGEHKDEEQASGKVQIDGQRPHARVKGLPGEIDDGWARLLRSLEEFPYEWYGIQMQANL
jgi:pseudouridine-5'-monophosphatase